MNRINFSKASLQLIIISKIGMNQNKVPQQQIYSLRGLLDADIDPTLCKLMLHQIKSPLLEHSFQITTDDDRAAGVSEEGHSKIENNYNSCQYDNDQHHSYQSTQYKKDQKLDQYSITNSYYETTPRYKNQPRHEQKDNNNFLLNHIDGPNQNNQAAPTDPYLESMVSPLQHYPNNISRQENFHIIFGNFYGNNQNGDKKNNEGFFSKFFCGTNMNQQSQSEIQMDSSNNDKHFIRKKIFKKPLSAYQNNNKGQKQERITFQHCIQKLYKIQEQQLGNFITFLSKCLPLFSKLVPYRNHLHNNVHLLRKIFLKHQPVDYMTKETIGNQGRIGNRVLKGGGEGKMSEVIEGILNLGFNGKSNNSYEVYNNLPSQISNSFPYCDRSGIRRNTLRQNNPICQGAQIQYNILNGEQKLQHDLEKVLQLYSKIQQHIEDYVSRQKSVEQLQLIYALLFPECNSKNVCHNENILDAVKDSQPILEQQLEQMGQKRGRKVSSPISNLKFTQQAQLLQKEYDKSEKQFQRKKASLLTLQYSHHQSDYIASRPLLSKIYHLLYSLHIDEAFYHNNLQELIYIWPNIMDNHFYAKNPSLFIKQICRNDVLMVKTESQLKQNRVSKNIGGKNYEQKFSKMGFVRNR